MAEPSRRRRRRRRSTQAAQERLARWKVRIDTARRVREEWEQRFQVERLERFWMGRQHNNEVGSDDDPMWLNHFFATVQTQEAILLPPDITFQVAARRGQEPLPTFKSKMAEGLLRGIADQDDHLNIDASLAVAQAFFRVGVLKTSYDPVFLPNPRAGEALTTVAGEFGESTPLLDAQGQPLVEQNESLTDEVYTWEWVNARTMLFPDEGPNPRKWSWIAEEIEVSLDEAKLDTRFPRNLRNQLVANATADENSRLSRGEIRTDRPQDQEHARFRFIEAYDIREKRLLVWAEGQPFDRFILDEDFEPGVEDHPYAILAFLPITGPQTCPWPLPVTYNWLPLQQQYNITRQQQINAGNRTARKFFYDEATFPDVEEMDKMLSSVDQQGVLINDATRPPIYGSDPPLGIDVARSVPLIRDDWRVITGQSGTRLGDPDADTATEAVLVEQAAGLRDGKMRTLVNRWLGIAGTKMFQLVQQTLTMDLWVEIRGFTDTEFQRWMVSDEVKPVMDQIAQRRYRLRDAGELRDALKLIPQLQTDFRERYGGIQPIKVTRSELEFQASVVVLPGSLKPLQQAQMVRMSQGLAVILAAGSSTLLEEYIQSFDLVSAERIAEEIMANLRQQEQAMAAGQATQGRNGSALPAGMGQGSGIPGLPNLQGANIGL